MKIRDLVYVRQCILIDGTTVSAIGIIKSITDRGSFKMMDVWFPEFGYAVSFWEKELILLEGYYDKR